MINNQNIAVLSEKVAALEAAIKNAGIELPEVTGADNGKTLQVVAGKWATGGKIPTNSDDIDYDEDTTVTEAINEPALDISNVFTLNTAEYETMEGAIRAFYDRKTKCVRGTFFARVTTGAIAINHAMFTVSSDYRPASDVTIPLSLKVGDAVSFYSGTIKSTGMITQSLSNNATAAYGSFEYYLS